MDLGEAGIGEESPAFRRAPSGGDIAAHRIGGKEEHIAVAASGQDHRVRRMGADLTGGEVTHDDALGMAIDQHEIQHLGAGEHLHAALVDLLFQCLVTSDQKLLAGLAAGIERARNLRATERTIV